MLLRYPAYLAAYLYCSACGSGSASLAGCLWRPGQSMDHFGLLGVGHRTEQLPARFHGPGLCRLRGMGGRTCQAVARSRGNAGSLSGGHRSFRTSAGLRSWRVLDRARRPHVPAAGFGISRTVVPRHHRHGTRGPGGACGRGLCRGPGAAATVDPSSGSGDELAVDGLSGSPYAFLVPAVERSQPHRMLRPGPGGSTASTAGADSRGRRRHHRVVDLHSGPPGAQPFAGARCPCCCCCCRGRRGLHRDAAGLSGCPPARPLLVGL